jgi:SAM-dependent methyltransferase
MANAPIYDRIGRGYAHGRQADHRSAGTGSYEPTDRHVVAVEPSEVMIHQRSVAAAPVVRAVAETLPFANDAFDAALAVLTVHHWTDAAQGLSELRRVAGRRVILTWDPDQLATFWFTRDYLPEAIALDEGFTTLKATLALLGPATVEPVAVPHDCRDGFFAAYWRRPEAYLDPAVRAGISGFGLLDRVVVDPALTRLAADLDSGEWHRRNAALLDLDQLDLGYRLVIAERD